MMAAKIKNTAEDMGSHRLSAVLERLSTQPDALSRERTSLPVDPRERLEALLREIDEIVLPRTLRVQANGTDIAALHVSNRRLSRLKHANAGEERRSEADTDANDLAMQLLEIAKTATSIRVEPVQTDQPETEDISSVSVSALRVALGLDRQVCEIDQLAQLIEPDAEATLDWTRDYSDPSFSGDNIWRARMEACAKHVVKTAGSNSDVADLKQSDTIGLAIDISDGKVLILACNAQKGTCFIAPRSEGLEAISNWQTVAC